MFPKSLKFLALVFLIPLSQVCLSQNGASSDSYLFIKNRIDSLNFYSIHNSQIDGERSKEYADQALFLAEKINYTKGKAEAYEMLGMYYGGREEFAKSLKMFFEFLEAEKQLQNLEEEIRANLRIAAMYINIHNFDAAKTYLTTALNVANKEASFLSLGWINLYFGFYYYEMRNTTEALKSAKISHTYFTDAGDLEMLARSEKLLGDIYIEYRRFDDANEAYMNAMNLFSRINFPSEEGILLTRIAHVYYLKGDDREVLKYNIKALRIRESLRSLILVSHSLVNIGKTYSRLGRSDSALYYLSSGLEVALSSGNNYAIQDAYYCMYTYYFNIGNLSAALTNFEHYFESYKKYSEERTYSEIYSLEIKYQIKDIEAQNQLLEQKLDIQTLELKNRSYSQLITQLIISVIGALLLILAYIFERNKLGKSKLERINKKLNVEVEERKLTEVQLRTSEELYRFVTDHTLDLIVRMDRNFNYLYISPSILRMFGFSPEDQKKLPPIRNLIPETSQDELRTQYLEMIRTKKPVTLTHQLERKDGSLFWAESLVNPIFDENTGKLVETITVIRDITDRVAYEESLSENARQKELLLREIHHRVKNNFAILVSLMNMQKVSSHPEDFKDFLTDLQGRIRTMSLVHELLYRSADIDYIHFGEYLGQLVSIISRAYMSQSIKIHTSIETCILDVETALPLGLISNEILTNAFKYAMNDNPSPELWIDLKHYTNEADPDKLYTHTLTIRDNGPGLPEGYSPGNQTSMGSQIITLLIDQLEGRLDFSGKGGATFTIYFSNEKRS